MGYKPKLEQLILRLMLSQFYSYHELNFCEIFSNDQDIHNNLHIGLISREARSNIPC